MKIYSQALGKKIPIVMTLLLLTFCTPVFAAQNPRSDFEERRRQVAAMMEAATVWIVAEDDESINVGSGFIIGNGYIVTNAHVIEDMKKGVTVYVLNDLIPVRKARIINTAYDKLDENKIGGKDFALLRFEPPGKVTLPVLTLNLDIKRMDRISAWGYPAMATQFDISTERVQRGDTSGLKPPPVIYTEGSVNAIVRGGHGNAILHSAQIAGGNSGGPLVNSRGEVVGINTWGYHEENEGAFLNGAQPASELARFLIKNNVTPKFAAGQQFTDIPPEVRVEKTKQPEKPQPVKQAREDRRRNVGSFSVLVPFKWGVVEEKTDSILLASDDEDALVGIEVRAGDGKGLLHEAKKLSKKMGGSKPQLDDDLYMFSLSSKGVDTTVFIAEANEAGEFVIITLTGDMGKPGVQEILDSVED